MVLVKLATDDITDLLDDKGFAVDDDVVVVVDVEVDMVVDVEVDIVVDVEVFTAVLFTSPLPCSVLLSDKICITFVSLSLSVKLPTKSLVTVVTLSDSSLLTVVKFSIRLMSEAFDTVGGDVSFDNMILGAGGEGGVVVVFWVMLLILI